MSVNFVPNEFLKSVGFVAYGTKTFLRIEDYIST